nr:MAG TPA: Rhomboid N-terminal domain [Caudoviricetes sp.]
MSDEQLCDIFMGVLKSEGVKCECDREFGIIVFWIMNLDNTIYIDGGLVSFCPNSILPSYYREHVDKIIRVMMTTIRLTLKGKANA